MWLDGYDGYDGTNSLWESSKTLKQRSDEMKEISETIGRNQGIQTDKAMMESLQEMISELGQARDPYEVATKEMDRQLKEKGLPSMEKILEALEESHPEFFL